MHRMSRRHGEGRSWGADAGPRGPQHPGGESRLNRSIPPPPDHPPPPLHHPHQYHHHQDRKRRRYSRSRSPSSPHYDRNRRRRPRSRSRRRYKDEKVGTYLAPPKSERHFHYLERPYDRSRSRRRDNDVRRRLARGRTMESSLSTRSSSGSRQHRRRHGRRRRKSSRRERRHRRHQDKKDHHDCSSKSPTRHAARSGIVSDEDGDRQHEAGSHPKGRKTEAQKKRRTSGRDGVDDESTYDDTIGHFQGREGTVISNRYRIERQVGMGTFGRVVECLDLHHHRRGGDRNNNNKKVAIKIVRNVKRYYESALIEADIVEDVNRRGGRGRTHCAVMFDGFSFSGHYCMVFEKLGPSLYDFQKRQNYRPFPLMCVRDFAKQLLETLEFLHGFGLIHTDLKPENILLINDREVPYKGRSIPESTRIKVIDFGAATYDNEKKSSVVNTRQYRAPEVILGVGWSMPSDLWSLGCILVELFQGELLFATHDNIEHLALIEQVVGPFPRRMIKRAKNTEIVDEAFDSAGAHRMERVLPPESFSYVKRIGSLEAITSGIESWFLRLLRRILVTDPKERATARECLRKL